MGEEWSGYNSEVSSSKANLYHYYIWLCAASFCKTLTNDPVRSSKSSDIILLKNKQLPRANNECRHKTMPRILLSCHLPCVNSRSLLN